MRTWAEILTPDGKPPNPELKAIYPFLTTVQGNRFRFRGGDPEAVRANLMQLLKNKLPGTVRTARRESLTNLTRAKVKEHLA